MLEINGERMTMPEIGPNGTTIFLDEKSFHLDNIDQEMHQVRKYLVFIKGIVEDEKNYIDSGGAAKIYTEPETGSCIKIMKNRHKAKSVIPFNLGASPKEEFSFLEELHGFEVSGVRSPIAEACIETGDAAIIIMERLNAVNLQHVLNGVAEMPEGFDFDDFYQSLEAYIDKMHTEKSITHGDLYPRNIMIDMETGKPYVIDFGRSKKIKTTSNKIDTELDWKRFDDLYTSLEQHRNNKVLRKEPSPHRTESFVFDNDIKIYYSEKIVSLALEKIKLNPELINESLKIGTNSQILVSSSPENIFSIKTISYNGKNFYLGKAKL
jgi:tRNA A-37 threonylcarbamoyl transferase component Bud32